MHIKQLDDQFTKSHYTGKNVVGILLSLTNTFHTTNYAFYLENEFFKPIYHT